MRLNKYLEFILERHYDMTKDNLILPKDMPVELYELIFSWPDVWESPHSKSYYSKEKDWNKTLPDTIRVSDHWNFTSKDKIHCATIQKCPDNSHYSVGIWNKELKKYDIQHSYLKKDKNEESIQWYRDNILSKKKEVNIENERRLKSITDNNELWVRYRTAGVDKFNKVKKVSTTGQKIAMFNLDDSTLNIDKKKMKNKKFFVKKDNDFEEVNLDMIKESVDLSTKDKLKELSIAWFSFNYELTIDEVTTPINFLNRLMDDIGVSVRQSHLSTETKFIERCLRALNTNDSIRLSIMKSQIDSAYRDLLRLKSNNNLPDRKEIENLILPIQDLFSEDLYPIIIYNCIYGFHWCIEVSTSSDKTNLLKKELKEELNNLKSLLESDDRGLELEYQLIDFTNDCYHIFIQNTNHKELNIN